LLNPLFLDTLLNIFLCIICMNSWYMYYINVNNITTPEVQSKDVKKPTNIELSRNMRSILIGSVALWFISANSVFTWNVSTSTIFYDSIYLSNNSISYLWISLSILLIITLSGLSLFNQNISFSMEYIIFVIMIITTSYLLLSSTNLFLTIFLLEFVALLIFGKLAVSRITIKKLPPKKINSFSNVQHSYGLFNSLFFQFWANFVSSVLLFFSLLNIHYMIGTSNFFIVNFLLLLMSSNLYLANIFISIILIALLTGFFIKLGLSPYQFFKIETYKGIPVYIIIVYTTLYLIIYVLIFSYIYVYQIPSLREFTGSYTIFILFLSFAYLVTLLFDTKNFKAFLSYSTLITISNLFIILFVL